MKSEGQKDFSTLGRNIKVFPSFVSQSEIKNICNSSDILLIFRSDSLNSGNIPLGFTFGCYVVGPNIGNIGEILIRNNNTVFDIKNIDYKFTVKHSIENLNDVSIQNNKKVALKYWNWTSIAKELKKIFLELDVCK